MKKKYKITNFDIQTDHLENEVLIISKIDQGLAQLEPFPHLADHLTEYFLYKAESINAEAMDNIMKNQGGMIEVDMEDFVHAAMAGTEDDPIYGYYHKLYLQEQSNPTQNMANSTTDFNYFQDAKHEGHVSVVSFFKDHPFGSNNPTMTYLSILSPTDRCIILEQLHNPNSLNSILNDKLLLAYVTNGRADLGKKVVQFASEKGESEMNIYGLQDKLDLPRAPERTGEQRIEIYADFLSKSQNPIETKFLNLMIKFCEEHY